MSDATANPEPVANGTYPIRTVSDLTGVNAITLRAWERRHGLFNPVRKAGGHRLYTQEHIDLINRVVGLLDHGMRIGQVRAHLEDEKTRSESTGTGDIWQRLRGRMIAAVIRFDESGLEEAYGEALANYPVETVTGKLIAPLLKELGRRWEAGEGSIAEEHFFAFYMRNKLGARFHHRLRSSGGPKLLLACLPGDRHETGLLMFALGASEAGYRTILLGADMPLDELPETARKAECDAIILSGLLQPAQRALEEQLTALKQAAGVPVFLGGRASVHARDALKRAGVEPLGTDINKGLERIRDSVPAG